MAAAPVTAWARILIQAESPSLERAGPPSPCVNVCTLDAAGLCVGCLRTVTEIAQWSRMGAEARWRVIAALPERRRQREERRNTKANG